MMFTKMVSIFLPVLMMGCTTYHGLEPLNPSLVDSTDQIRPHFKWKPSPKKGVKYDFIIYEKSLKEGVYIPAATIYYREGLDNPEHKIERNLEPRVYLWAVRERESGVVGPWSRYDLLVYFVFGHIRHRNHFYELTILAP